jgi:hypothetical protein
MNQKIKCVTFLVALFGWLVTDAQQSVNKTMQSTEGNSPVIEKILKDYKSALSPVLENPSKYRLQILYTQINRDNKNRPSFVQHAYRSGAEYFYPASTVKLPAAVLALEYINTLKKYGVDKYTSMLTDGVRPNEKPVLADSTSENGKPSVAQYIRKILLVSDNDAYNRLYELIGQEGFNKRLHALGFKDAQIVHRLSISLSETQNRETNPIRFVDAEGNLLYKQPARMSHLVYANRNDHIGNGYMKGDQLVSEPLDFSAKNRWSLSDIHQLVQWIMFPETQPKNNGLRLNADDYIFLRKYMSMMPQESSYPKYPTADYWPTYVKFLLYGSEKNAVVSPDIRLFNKVGDAYGFLIDGAYVVDFKNGVEFILSAVLYCNEDGILNDDAYDYDSIGFPFFKALGTAVYETELKRKKNVTPYLENFRFQYKE